MKIWMFKCVGILSLIILLSGCGRGEDSEDVNQDTIYTVYEAFYNENDDVTHIVARFRFGGPIGTLLQLTETSGASVSFNGEALSYSAIWGGHHTSFAGNVTSGTFIYTNTEGETFTNTLPSGTSIGFPESFTSLSKSQAYTLEWEGLPLAVNDHVGIFVGTWSWGDDALFYTNTDGASSIVLGVNALSNLITGTATVYMDRWNEESVAEGTPEGGRILYKYRGMNATVLVTD